MSDLTWPLHTADGAQSLWPDLIALHNRRWPAASDLASSTAGGGQQCLTWSDLVFTHSRGWQSTGSVWSDRNSQHNRRQPAVSDPIRYLPPHSWRCQAVSDLISQHSRRRQEVPDPIWPDLRSLVLSGGGQQCWLNLTCTFPSVGGGQKYLTWPLYTISNFYRLVSWPDLISPYRQRRPAVSWHDLTSHRNGTPNSVWSDLTSVHSRRRPVASDLTAAGPDLTSPQSEAARCVWSQHCLTWPDLSLQFSAASSVWPNLTSWQLRRWPAASYLTLADFSPQPVVVCNAWSDLSTQPAVSSGIWPDLASSHSGRRPSNIGPVLTCPATTSGGQQWLTRCDLSPHKLR